MNKITRLHVTAGYAGRGKVEAQIEGTDEWHVIDSDHFENVMMDLFNTNGFKVTKSNRQKHPRLTLNK